MFEPWLGVMLSAIPESGGYFSTLKIAVMLVLLPPWLYALTWMNKDVDRVHARKLPWILATMGGGATGLLLWLAIDLYLVGLGSFLLLAYGTTISYVLFRNRRVIPGYRVLTAQHLSNFAARQKPQKVDVVQKLKFYDSLARPFFAPPEEQAQDRQAYNLVQTLLYDALSLRASEVDLAPAGMENSVRFVIDGVALKRPSLTREDADTIIAFIKKLAGMNVEDVRRPQTGKLGADAGAQIMDIKVATAGTTSGQRLQLRFVQELAQTRLEELGMPPELQGRLEELNAATGGLIVVSGPRGSGVTSTLYSLLRRHDAFMKQLATLEQSPAVEMENVTHNRYKDAAELPTKLASVLRRDPDVVMVDRCESLQVADLITEGAQKKNILLGMSGESSFVALARWVKLCGGDRAKALASLKAVTSQVLIRKLCPACKEAYRPARDLVAKLNLPADKCDKFFRPPTKPLVDEKGRPMTCATCRNTHYYGRAGVFELLEITPEIRELILGDAAVSKIKAACRKNRMLYLQEQGLRKVMEGVTGIEEVVRVTKTKDE